MPNDSCQLKWQFCDGTWTAYSQIMDPLMTDEKPEEWCREWCLQWIIYVDEDGKFRIDQSDSLLRREADDILKSVCTQLDLLIPKIELLEDYLRGQETLRDGSKVVLLPKEVYCAT